MSQIMLSLRDLGFEEAVIRPWISPRLSCKALIIKGSSMAPIEAMNNIKA